MTLVYIISSLFGDGISMKNYDGIATSPDPSNTIPPPSTKNGNHNIYECMVDVSKLTPSQHQHHAVMLLQHYHELCNTNDPLSMFVSPPPITNIESLSRSTISSLDSGSFGRNRADVNIQQQTTLEVSYIDTVMADNDEIDPQPPQDISSVCSRIIVVSFIL